MSAAGWTPTLRSLIADGTLDGQLVVEGRVCLDDVSRSNDVSIMRLDDDERLVLKRAGLAVDEVDPFEAEVRALRWIHRQPALHRIAPRLVDASGDVMKVCSVPRSRQLGEVLFVANRQQRMTLLGRLGNALGRLHATAIDTQDADRPGPRRPWVLDLAHTTPTFFSGDDVVERLVDDVRRDRSLLALLTAEAERWRPEAPMHGDIKLDNVLVDEPIAGYLAVTLIDWELAGCGPPAWDLAGVIVGLLMPRLLTGSRDTADDTPGELSGDISGETLAASALNVASRSVGAHRDATPRRLHPTAQQLVSMTAVRLVQTAIQLAAMRHLDEQHLDGAANVLSAASGIAAVVPTGSAALR